MSLLKIFIQNKDKILVDIKFNYNKTAIIGASGSGKSITLKAILGLLNLDYNIEGNLPKNISFVPQNPFTSLSPLTKIKHQFFVSKKKQEELLELVSLGKDLLNRYPIELSGGQLQRIIIAIAFSTNPDLILFDEPTTALDTNTKKDILKLIKDITKDKKIIFVTHDIFSIKDLCDNIIVINKGKIVESGKTDEILTNPKEEYSKKLIEANFAYRNFRE